MRETFEREDTGKIRGDDGKNQATSVHLCDLAQMHMHGKAGEQLFFGVDSDDVDDDFEYKHTMIIMTYSKIMWGENISDALHQLEVKKTQYTLSLSFCFSMIGRKSV